MTVVNYVLDWSAAGLKISRRGFGVVADRDGADGFVVIRNPERLAERPDGFGHDAKNSAPRPSSVNWHTMCRCRTTSWK